MKIIWAILLLIGSASAFATTCKSAAIGSKVCFVSYTDGSDANTGDDSAHPLKYVPGMIGYTSAITPGADAGCTTADQFILKGGDTWPNAAFWWRWQGTWKGCGDSSVGVSSHPITIKASQAYFTSRTVTSSVYTFGINVTRVSGYNFDPWWVGTSITINGSACTVTAIIDSNHLTCSASMGSLGTAYSGVTLSFTGATKYIFDLGGTAVVGTQSGFNATNDTGDMMKMGCNFCVLQDFEVTRFYWDDTKANVSQFVIFNIIGASPQTGVVFSNGWVHGWTHAPGATQDTRIFSWPTGSNCQGGQLFNMALDGADSVDHLANGDSGPLSMIATYGGATPSGSGLTCPLISHSEISYTSTGAITPQGGSTYNIFHHIGNSIGTGHEDILFVECARGDAYHDNYIYAGLAGAVSFWVIPDGSFTANAYNNLILDVQDTNVINMSDPSFSPPCTGTLNFAYNTVECGQDAGNGGNGPAGACITPSRISAVNIANNQFITSGTAVATCTVSCPTVNGSGTTNGNITQTKAQAAASGLSGYTLARQFQPSTGGATIASGSTLSSVCPTCTLPASDIIGVTRSVNPSDIGSFQFFASAGSYTVTYSAAGSNANGTLTETALGTATYVAGIATSCGNGTLVGGNCTMSYTAGSTPSITATATTGLFAGFSGGGCSISPCIITVNLPLTITATFQLPTSISVLSNTLYCNPVNGCKPTLTATVNNCNIANCAWFLMDYNGTVLTDITTGKSASCSFGALNDLCSGTPSGVFTIHWNISDFSFNPFNTVRGIVFIPLTSSNQSAISTVDYGVRKAGGGSWLQF